MTDSHARLRQTLAELRAELQEAGDVPADVQARLEQVIAEIDQGIVAAPPPVGRKGVPDEEGQPSLTERLAESARDFENSHPTLSGMVGSVIDALSRMGI